MIIIHAAQKFKVLYKAEIKLKIKNLDEKDRLNFNISHTIDCDYDYRFYQTLISLSEY